MPVWERGGDVRLLGGSLCLSGPSTLMTNQRRRAQGQGCAEIGAGVSGLGIGLGGGGFRARRRRRRRCRVGVLGARRRVPSRDPPRSRLRSHPQLARSRSKSLSKNENANANARRSRARRRRRLLRDVLRPRGGEYIHETCGAARGEGDGEREAWTRGHRRR
ncbi:hypothetical protein B0H13DRAFT_2079848, partial [Mycena leptocephala]